MTPLAPSGGGPVAQRILWIDAARGIGIVLVVAGHVERGLVSAGVAVAPMWSVVDLAIYSFHMALFLLLAGVNGPNGLQRGRASFVGRKVKSVYYPYLIWSLIQGGALVALALLMAGGAANSAVDWRELAAVPWRPILQFWFLYVLMAYLLVLAVVGMRRGVLIGLAVAALAGNAVLGELSLLNRLLFFFPFFIAGVLMGGWLKTGGGARIGWLVACVGAWVASVVWLMPADPLAKLSLATLPSAILGTIAVLLVAQRLSGRVQTAMVWLGQRSLSIFVMHILASAAVRIALQRIAPDAGEGVYFAAGMTAGLLLPCLALMVAERLKLVAVLGLDRRPSVSTG